MQAPEESPPTRAAPRSRRRLVAIALGILAFAGIARAALPELLRRLIESNASDALGRRVEVADVDLGLVMGLARVEGLAVGGPDRQAPIEPESAPVRCESLGARIAWLPLLTGNIHLREIALVGPRLRLERRADGALAPIVLAPPEPEPAPDAGAEADGGIDFAIDRLSLDAAGLALVRHDASPIAELSFENLTLHDLSLLAGTFGIGAVSLREPELQVHAAAFARQGEAPATAAEGAAAPAAPSPAPEAPAAPSAGSQHRIAELEIQAARFAWRLPDGEAIQAELELRAKDLGVGGAPFPLEIRLTTDGASLALEGELALEPLRFEGDFRWEGVRLARLARLAPDAPVKVAEGRSDGALEISLRLPPAAPDAPAGLRLRGDARVAELDLASGDGALSLRWKDLAVTLAPLMLPLGAPAAAPEIHLAKLELAEPQVEFVRAPPEGEAAPAEPTEPEGTAPAEPAEPAESAEPEGTAPAEPEPPGEPPRVLVDALEVTGGRLRLHDTTVRPAVDTSLRDLRIRAQGVRWPERDVEKLLLTAKGQRGATLKLEGQIARGTGSIGLDLRQLPLAPFGPYAATASGLEIEDGRLSLTSKLSLGADRIGAKSKLSLHQLSVTERESGWFQKAFGVPLDVALALLRDLEGDITLPVDVEQGAGGTSVGIAAAVASALRQALTGALAAPLKLLGGVAGQAGAVFSGGPLPIPMEPGHAELTAEAHERVAALAKLLGTRPGLRVLLVGHADPSDDPQLAVREVFARAKAGEPLAGEDELGFLERRRVRGVLADADPEDQDALDAETAAALERLAPAVQVSEEARQALALARAQAVAQALQEEHGTPADAVAALETGVGAPGVEIELRASSE